MRRLHADRGDNPDPGIGHQSTCSKKIVDERCAIRQRTQFAAGHGSAPNQHDAPHNHEMKSETAGGVSAAGRMFA
jgi:hypothetical protein